jgi:hypothetical protein
MKFKALIDSIHYDPKKGAVKIVLIGASHVSLDELTTLSPKEEIIQDTFESAQTKIDVYPLVPEDATTLDTETAEKLRNSEEDASPNEVGETYTDVPPRSDAEGEGE